MISFDFNKERNDLDMGYNNAIASVAIEVSSVFEHIIVPVWSHTPYKYGSTSMDLSHKQERESVN